jgi:hypothetical protein
MFLPWFGPSEALERSFDEARRIQEQFGGPEVPIPDVEQNAWEAFGVVKYILVLTALAGVGLAALRLVARPPVSALAASTVAFGLGVLSTALVLYRVVDPIEDSAREAGLFLGLLAAGGIALGGWLTLRDAEASRGPGPPRGPRISPEADRRGPGPPVTPSR